MNNVETDRKALNAVVPEAILRDYWLPHVRDAVVEGKAQSLMASCNAIGGAERFQAVADVDLHGDLGDAGEGVGDLRVGAALHDEAEDFEFAFAQGVAVVAGADALGDE